MSHRLRAWIAVLFVGCVAEETDFTLGFTFKGAACGGLDLLGRPRVAKVEFQVFGPGDPTAPLYQATMPCTDEPLQLTLEPSVRHRVVVRGIGDDGVGCFDTGPEGIAINTWVGEAEIDVPQVCMLNDAVRLTLEVEGQGRVTAEPAGIDCPSVSCVAVYDQYAGVRLTAKPSGGAVFSHWSSSCGGFSPTVTIPMFSSRECKATFVDPSQSGWSGRLQVPGPGIASEWDAIVEGVGPLVVHSDGASVGSLSATAPPDDIQDWRSAPIFDGSELIGPRVALELYQWTWVTAGYARSDGCGIAVGSRPTIGAPFASREIEISEQPCAAMGGLALAAVDGALILATQDEGETAILSHVIEGSSISTHTIYQAPAAQALRGTSGMIANEGRAAFAFSIFDRSREQGEVWIAIARSARPAATSDWELHRLFASDRVPTTPALLVDGARFLVTFGTIAEVGRETEQRSQHLGISLTLSPAGEGDWRVVLVDAERGGPPAIERHGSDLKIAFGHTDTMADAHSIVVATSMEATPIGPESFSVAELDQTVVPAQPRFLDFGSALGILYRQSGDTPLVFRSTPTF